VELVLDSLNNVHQDLYGPMLENIILTGGNTRIPGFLERL